MSAATSLPNVDEFFASLSESQKAEFVALTALHVARRRWERALVLLEREADKMLDHRDRLDRLKEQLDHWQEMELLATQRVLLARHGHVHADAIEEPEPKYCESPF